MRTPFAGRFPSPLGAFLLAGALAACATSPAGTRAAGSGGTGAPTSAGAPSGASSGVTGSGTAELASAPFVGSRKSRKYYPAACHTVRLVQAADRVGFASMKDAENAGFSKDLYSTDCRY